MKQTRTLRKFLRQVKQKVLLSLVMLFVVSVAFSQERTITGFVTDEAKNPIPGANVVIKGTTTGTVTDIDGKFSLKASNSATVVISFLGYENAEIPVGDLTTLNVVLKEKTTALDDIIVIGYGVQKKSDLTGSVVSVSSEQLLKTPSNGAVQALQGKAAGVQILNNNGMPGAGITIRVRGINSINGNGQPLYIIDGVGGDINSINQNDIEHIEILKDASAQAIYGSSGGNGVVIVTTKQGAKNQKAKVEFSMYRGVQTNDLNVKMTDTREFIQIYNSLDATKNSRITADPDSLPNTNWWNEISHNAIMEEYNLAVSGGTENLTSLFSIGYLKQDGVVKKTNYERFNIRSNSSYNINKFITIGENLSLSATRNQGNDGWGSPMGAIGQSPISYIRDTSSNLTPQQIKDKNIGYDGWAQPLFNTGTNNPVANIYYDNNKSGSYRMAGNLFGKVEFVKGLTYNNNFGFDVNFWENDNFMPYYFISATQNNSVVRVSRQLDRSFSWSWQHVLNYKTTLFEKHNIDIMAGIDAGEWLQKSLGGSADSLLKNGATPEYQYIDATLRQFGSEFYKSWGGYGHSTNYAYFSRLNYNFNELLYGQFTYRYEGSTHFGPSYRFGSFPALSTGFKFSELDVIKDNLTFLSFGKIRFGWGKTGNANIPGDKFSSLVKVSSGYGYPFGSAGTPGGVALAPGNPELHWEGITTYNYGLDLNFFDNKLSMTADYFDKKTTGMLMNTTMPLIAGRYGFSGTDGKYTDHIGSLSNKGFEFSLGYKDNVGDLKYSVDFNITKIVSKLYDLKDTLTLPDWESNPKAIRRNGNAPGVFWGYKTDGLFRPADADSILDPGAKKKRYVAVNQPYRIDSKGRKVFLQNSAQPGDLRFVDTNGDTILNDKDKVIIGDPNPDFTFGFTINLEYKGFDLNAFFQGSYGNDIWNGSKGGWFNSQGMGNWSKDALNAYRAPVYDKNGNMTDPGNTTSNQFRLYGTTADNYRMSDWYVEDGSYIRLKSIQLGYTLPQSISKKYGIERLRVYVGGKNLITWTKYTGLDPEVGGGDATYFGVDGGSYPQPTMYSAGLNVTF